MTLAKSVKNAAELAGLREAHLRDGAALVRFLCWLEKTIASGEGVGSQTVQLAFVAGCEWRSPCALAVLAGEDVCRQQGFLLNGRLDCSRLSFLGPVMTHLLNPNCRQDADGG